MLIGGLLGYVGSYAVSPVYDASTSLLVRGRDATVLSSTGQNLVNQPVIDSNLTTALAETQSALLASRTVAESVVDDLGLEDIEPAPQGLFGRVKSSVGDAYRSTKTFLTHGFKAHPTKREAAIAMVHAGLSAQPLEDSYVIELHASADDPKLAAAIANSAADALIGVSQERFRGEAISYRDFLSEQLETAATRERDAAEAVRSYKQAHGISDVGIELELTARTAEDLQIESRSNDVALSGARAELASVEESLATLQKDDENVTEIQTGRSTTEIRNTGSNSVYTEMLVRREQLRAEVAAFEARQSALSDALGGTTGSLTGDEAELRQLELQYQLARDSYADLSEQHQEATLNANSERVELTRLDLASAPDYPVSPVRYLYLGLGNFAGLVIGLLLSALAAWRRGVPLLPDFSKWIAAPDGNVPDIGTPNGASDRAPNGASDDVVPSPARAKAAAASESVIDLGGGADEPVVGSRRSSLGSYELFEGGQSGGTGGGHQ
jgi:uncharacterized protein involved in exopolysaccharide biosynthesis